MSDVQNRFQYWSKVIAALAAMIPLAMTWEALEDRLSTEQVKLIQNPLVAGPLIFGTAFASNGDPQATLTAMVLAYVLLEMYRGQGDAYRSTEERVQRRRRTL